ncbi:MAG: WbuC family cupin fold metalloprotein [Cyanobacteria bacterium REEB444]|nr:WbuC family cupin fold metalloprotein [Cyanobacteria bacterium REEB444]
MSIYKENSEVLYSYEDVFTLSPQYLDELKQASLNNDRQRIRLCAHRSPDDSLHEMFIVHTNECYVRPHRHIGKIESMAILEGEVDVVLFHDNGDIKQVIEMGEPNSGKIFFYRLDQPIYHTLIIHSRFLVFHEITEGPFLRDMTQFPDWAPLESNPNHWDFITGLKSRIEMNEA